MVKKVRGQVTLFVVIAVVVVGALLLILILRSGSPLPVGPAPASDPEQYIQNCMQDKTQRFIEQILPRSGFAQFEDSVRYKGVAVPYLCKNINFYEPCINQEPLLLTEVEKHIGVSLTANLTECLTTLEQELRNERYDVVRAGPAEVKVELREQVVLVNLITDLTITKGEVASRFTTFTTRVRSPLYELLTVINEIVTQEARFCYFSTEGFTLLNPEFDIRRDVLPDATKIYSVEDVSTGNIMYAAVRGCAIPAGF